MNDRIDRASAMIEAPVETVFQALIDPQAWLTWLPPEGMTGTIEKFDATVGGHYAMTLTYTQPDSGTGKSSETSDVISGRFLEIVPNDRVVQAVQFDSDDPQFSGEMVMTWQVEPTQSGTLVAITATNVPDGISPEDHQTGFQSSLTNLARYLERTT